MKKTCTRCKVVKDAEDFYQRGKGRFAARDSYCKDCKKELSKEQNESGYGKTWRDKNKS